MLSLVKSKPFSLQSATYASFSEPIPAISHSLKLRRSADTIQNWFSTSKTFFIESKSFKKKFVSSAYAVYKKSWLNMLIPWIFLLDFIEIKNNSNASINRYAEIGSPCLAPRSRLKYVVVWPPLITQNSWFLNKILIQSIKSSPKPYFLRTAMRNLWFNESKSFSKSNHLFSEYHRH